MLRTNEERETRLSEWIAERRRADYHFNVAPRYTAGSPAMVDERTAFHVASSELSGYGYASDERYGTEGVERARKLGVSGIAFAMRELPRGKGWDILDLITGERITRPFDVKKLHWGDPASESAESS